ncbi:UNVERIFIED_CONTAM: hypothetical protein K2H54_043581 [Gekko kuhli]
MRPGLFFLSVGLLGLGANLPRTSGQNVTGHAPSPPTLRGFPPPSANLDLEDRIILTCLLHTFNSDAAVTWFLNGKAVATSIRSTSNPLPEGGTREEVFPFAKFIIKRRDMERGEKYICLANPAALPPLTVQKTEDKDTGNPSSSDKTKTSFQEVEAVSEMFISCTVEGDRPPGVFIMWQENNRRPPEGSYTIHTRSEDRHFLYSTLTLPNTTRLVGRLYLCIIGQQRA